MKSIRTITLFCLLIGMFFSSVNAYAEGNCPQGEFPIGGGNGGWTGCAPIPGYWDNQQQPDAPPPPKWQNRWGAIVTDGDKGILGVAINTKNQSIAEQTARMDCSTKGGTNCKLKASFVNGCGVMVVDDEGFTVSKAPTMDEATQLGMKTCKDSGATNCRVYFTTCSPAVRIQ